MIQFTNVERFDAGTNEQYHAGEGTSNSQIGDFIDDPALFNGLYRTGEIEKSPPTPDMLIGTALHELCFEGGLQTSVLLDPSKQPYTQEEYDKELSKFSLMTRIPDHVLNAAGHCKGSDYTDWAKQFKGRVLVKSREYDEKEAKLRNAIIVPDNMNVMAPDTMDMLDEMLEALQAHDAASRLLFGEGENEVPIRGVEVATGVNVRCKLDRFSETVMGGFCADLKTVRDASPRGFANSVARFGYHRQRVLYGLLVEGLLGREVPFYFVCIEKKKPYRVEVYELDVDWIPKAIDELEKALRGIRRCEQSGVWQHEHYGELLSLPMPKYLNYADEWEAA